MVAVNVSYPDFSAGEISPKMYGRFDLQAYYKGGRRVENFIPQVVGSASFRTGTVFANKTRLNQPAFLYKFEFTDAIAFTLEFTENRIRFYRNNGLVKFTGQAITGITQANPAVVTYDGADTYANGDSVYISGVVGMTQVNNQEFIIANVDTGANTFELSGVNSTGYTAYSSGGTVEEILEVTTTYQVEDLFQLKFAQINQNLYIAHPLYNPKKLTYTNTTSWAITDHSPTGLTLSANNYPTAVGFYEQRLVYAGSNNNPNTLYFSKPALPDNFTVGTAVDDGVAYTIAGNANRVRWLRGTNKFLAVGSYGDIYQVTGGIDNVITPSSISIRPTNSFGVSDMMPIGKGSQVFFTQSNNLVVRSFEYDFQQDSYIPVDRNTVADHITLSGVTQIDYQEGRPNILWCAKNNGELIGLTIEEGESISGWHRHSTDGEITSVASISRVSKYDQLWLCVKRVIEGVDTYYVEYLSDIAEYPLEEDFFTGNEETDRAKYINRLFEAQKEYIHMDSSISFYGDTTSVTMTPSAVSGTSVTFTAGGSVFVSGDVGREIWRKSTTGAETGRARITGYTSATVVTCEILETFNSTSAIPAGQWYFTSDSFTGLEHLEGKEVTIVVDGGQHPVRTVDNGAVTLDRQASVVHIGLGFTGYLESNDIEGGGITGPAQTKKKSLIAVGLRFLNTLYAKFGTGYYNTRQIEMRTANMKMDRPPELFTGDVKSIYANDKNDRREAGLSREKRVVVIQDQPFPCNVQLIIPYVTVSN
jgi:hypothetical protein